MIRQQLLKYFQIHKTTYFDLTDIYTENNQFLEVSTSSKDIFFGISKYIANAKFEVNLTFYNWYTNTDPANVILTALNIALQQFIPTKEHPKFIIRFLFSESIFRKDYITSELNDAINLYDLSKAEIQIYIKRYYGLGSYHFKYICIDNDICLITGANVQDTSNFIQRTKIYDWSDIGLILRGDATYRINQHFQNVANFKYQIYPFKEKIGKLPILILTNPANGTISNKFRDLQKSYNSNLNVGVIHSLLLAKHEINIVTPNINDAIIFYTLIDIILHTHVIINILTSYHFDYFISEHYESGANSKYLYNLIYFNNLTYQAYLNERLNIRWYSYDGYKLLEGRNSHSNHAKGIFIDGYISIVGSYNLTTQSTCYFGELSVLIDDKFVYQQIKKVVFDKNWEKGILYKLIY